MKQKKKSIFKINGLDLTIDIVLVDYIYPVLFTCVDNAENLYIVTCYHADGNTMEWLIADTTPQKVIAMLRNEVTIRSLFLGTPLWRAILCAGETVPSIEKVSSRSIDQRTLPTSGEFMDADDGEFQEEIGLLTSRNKDSYGKAAVLGSVLYDHCVFPVIILNSHKTIAPHKEAWHWHEHDIRGVTCNVQA